MRKRLRTVMFGIGLMILLAQPAFAEELGQANITPDMTMQEIRSDPVMQQSGLFLYGSFGEGTQWTRSRLENQTLQEYAWGQTVPETTAALNLAAQNVKDGVQVTWQVYSSEETEVDPSLGCVQLFYFPGSDPDGKYAIVIGGNAIVVSAEIREGISTAWNLHEMGYPVFVLRYRIGMKASNNAPLQDVVRAVQYITEHAGQFGVQAEDYAIVSYSSGGQIAGLFGTDAVGYKNYGLPKPGAMLLGYPVNTFLEFKPVYNILLDPGVCKQRYYKMTLSDYITPDYPPTYHWYGKNDMTLMTMCWSAQGPVLEKALARNHVTHIYHVYDDAPHAVAAGKGTDAEGWLNEAVAFWEEQVG